MKDRKVEKTTAATFSSSVLMVFKLYFCGGFLKQSESTSNNSFKVITPDLSFSKRSKSYHH